MTDPEIVHPLASPRLQALGFVHDPFAYPEAEKIPVDGNFLEKTFVPFSVEAQVSSLTHSTILLAQPGGGKTRVRLHLESMLSNLLYSFMQDRPAENFPKAPLVVRYLNFERLTGRLPNITLHDHRDPFLEALASAIWRFIEQYPERFSQAEPDLRAWWWRFLRQYIEDDRIERRAGGIFNEEWKKCADCLPAVGSQTTLTTLLIEIVPEQIKGLGLDSLFIFIDSVDGWMETQKPELQAALINPLINSFHLLSSPGLRWKFFMPTNTLKQMTESAGVKTGRLSVADLKWDQTDLGDLLNNRLYWASNGVIEELEKVFAESSLETQEALEQLADMALRHRRLGPPRAILSLSNRLFEIGFYEKDPRVTKQEWKNFVKTMQVHLRPVTTPTSSKHRSSVSPENISTDPTSGQRVKVFISYAHENEEIAKDLYTRINSKKHEIQALIDKRTFEIGEPLDKEIEEKLSDVDCLLVVWSRHAKKSSWVETEISWGVTLFTKKGARLKKIIFVMLDKAKLPLAGQARVCLDMRGHSLKSKAYQEKREELVRTLRALNLKQSAPADAAEESTT
jgi:hypothetical protein